MKSFKILTTAVLTTLLSLVLITPAFAATESDIIKALKDAGVPETYIIQAENYLDSNDVSSSQADAIIAQIEKADAIMEAAGTNDITKLSSAQKDEIRDAVNAAAAELGLTVTIEAQANGSYEFTFSDASGNVIAVFSSNQVKQTGSNNIFLFGGISLMLAAAGSGLLLRRKLAVQ